MIGAVKKKSRPPSQQWAAQITALRDRLGINQAELARRMECSAMTVSRWERGLLQPSAEHFVQLGNLGNKAAAWFFWEMAGIEPQKMVGALGNNSQIRKWSDPPAQKNPRATAPTAGSELNSKLVEVPVLKAVAGALGTPGDHRTSLRTVPSTEVIGAPAAWCPHPAYTSMLRLKGHSMEPAIRDGDLLAVDAYQTEQSSLYGKVVVAASPEKGLCVSWLRRLDNLTILEAENRTYDSLVLSKAGGWRIVGRVLWWISAAP